LVTEVLDEVQVSFREDRSPLVESVVRYFVSRYFRCHLLGRSAPEVRYWAMRPVPVL